MRRLAGILIGLAAAGACAPAAAPMWVHVGEARALSPLMVRASDVGLGEADAIGDFLLPVVTATAEVPAPDSWAEFAIRVPEGGTYHLWARARFPAQGGVGGGRPGAPPTEAFRIAPVGDASPGAEMLLVAGDAGRRWRWIRCGEVRLREGQWTFRVFPHRAAATTFGPLAWRKAELTQTPRLNALCLSADAGFVPSDDDAVRGLAIGLSAVLDPRVEPARLGPRREGAGERKPVPDWMRCPRWFTKDSWREELAYRDAGDIAALVREVAANGGEALRLSVFWGGETYYPSRVAPRVPGLGDLDYLREALDEGRRTGVRVVVYMNPNALYGEHPLYPEAALRKPDGKASEEPAYGWKRPDTFYACINHPGYRKFLRDVLEEMFTRYGPDGLYVDGLTPHACFCEHCRAKWRAMFGSEMPVEHLAKIPARWAVWGEFGRDPQPVGDVENDPEARRFTDLMLASLVEVTREFAATVKTARPGAVTLFHSHPKSGCEEAYDGTLTEVYSPRPWTHVAWRSGELAGYSSVYRVPLLFNIYPHRHFSAAEARYHALQGLANGAYPNFWNALGMRPVFEYMGRCARYLDFNGAMPVRFLALPRDLRASGTQQKAARATGADYGSRDRFLAPYVGAYSALMRSGLPIVTLHRPRFEEGLEGFAVLALANVALMGDAQVEAVRRFVRAGGGLIATHETSLLDETGRRRPDFALADVFGAHCESVLPAAPRLMRIKKGHALAAGLPPDPVLFHDEPFVVARPDGAETAGALVPGEGGEVHPAILAHRFGAGRVIYLPGRLDSMQCYKLYPEIERLFANAVRCVAPRGLPVEVDAPATLGVTLFQQPGRLVAHLVNHARDSLFRSDAFAPAHGVAVRLTVPDGARVRRATRLWEDRDVPFAQQGPTVRVDVGTVGEYEAIAVEF